jgi:hypothetical protein
MKPHKTWGGCHIILEMVWTALQDSHKNYPKNHKTPKQMQQLNTEVQTVCHML